MRRNLVCNVRRGADTDKRVVLDMRTIDLRETSERVQCSLPIVGDLEPLHERFKDRNSATRGALSYMSNGLVNLDM